MPLASFVKRNPGRLSHIYAKRHLVVEISVQASGSCSLRRRYMRESGGRMPMPRQMRQAARRWFSPHATTWRGVSWGARVWELCTYDDRGYNGGDEEGKVNLHIGEEDEPLVPAAFLELARAFCATDTACWVFSADTWRQLVYHIISRCPTKSYQSPGRTDRQQAP
jgi:hypothetical protein